MKLRKGFVTNSSSSSYVCDVCANSEVVEDGTSLEYVYMCQCKNDHVFCKKHLTENLPKYPSKSSVLKEYSVLLAKNEDSLKDHLSQDRSKISVDYLEYLQNNNRKYKKAINEIKAIEDTDVDAFIHFIKENEVFNTLGIYMKAYILSDYCPICNLKIVTDQMRMKYVLNKLGCTEENMDNEIRSNFNNYKDAIKYLDK